MKRESNKGNDFFKRYIKNIVSLKFAIKFILFQFYSFR